jgi:hypothetical protein
VTTRKTLLIALFTTLYLCFELAFNARLLDVVGGVVDPTQLRNIERFGRGLSGIAVALVVLQLLLGRRERKGKGNGKPAGSVNVGCCTGAAVLVFVLIEAGVDQFVSDSALTQAILAGASDGARKSS